MTRSIPLPNGVSGALRLHSMPGRYESLDQFRDELKREAIAVIVCLAESQELRTKSPSYAAAIEAKSVPCSFESFPISDYGVPEDREAFWSLASKIATQLRAGGRVLIHCAGGIGRSGMLATCVLLALGVQKDQAVRTILVAGSRAEAAEQKELISWCAERGRDAN